MHSVSLGNRCVCICVCHQNRDCRQSSRPFKQPQFTFVPFSFHTHWILFFSMSDHRMLNSTCVLLLLSCRSTVPCLFLQFLALHTSCSFIHSFFLAYLSFIPFSSLLFLAIVHDQMLLFAHSMLFCTQFCRLVSFLNSHFTGMLDVTGCFDGLKSISKIIRLCKVIC